MFLKNDSKFQCVLRTKKNVYVINPTDSLFILDSEIDELNSCLTRIDEEEFNKLQKQTNKAAAKEAKKEDKKEAAKDEVKEEVKEEKKEEVTSGEITVDTLTAKLEELTIAWQEAKKPSKKEAIQKEMNVVQEKINKLK